MEGAGNIMADKGSRDKAGKEERKKPKLTIKEKRKLKREKKNET
jgi:ribosomal protein S30